MGTKALKIDYDEELTGRIKAGDFKGLIGDVMGFSYFMATEILDLKNKKAIEGKDQAFFDNLTIFLHRNMESIKLYLDKTKVYEIDN